MLKKRKCITAAIAHAWRSFQEVHDTESNIRVFCTMKRDIMKFIDFTRETLIRHESSEWTKSLKITCKTLI